MGPGDKVKVYTPLRSYHIDDGGSRMLNGGRQQFTLDNSVRVVAKGEDPATIMTRVEYRLALEERAPQPRVTRSEVMNFLHSVAEDPTAHKESYVYSQLDLWRRRALPFLMLDKQVLGEHRFHDYANAMRRYIERTYPANGVNAANPAWDTLSIMRFSRRERDGWEYIGYNGWPLQGYLPSKAEIFVNSGMELGVNWRRREFVETIADGLKLGGVMVMSPPLSLRRWGAQASVLPVIYGDEVRLAARKGGEISVNTFELMLRAASMLMGERALAGKLTSTPPEWWFLNDDPLSMLAQTRYLDRLNQNLWDYERAIRFVSSDRLIRLQRGMSTKMVYGDAPTRHESIWGVIAEGNNMAHARAILTGIGYVLKHHGRRVSSPSG